MSGQSTGDIRLDKQLLQRDGSAGTVGAGEWVRGTVVVDGTAFGNRRGRRFRELETNAPHSDDSQCLAAYVAAKNGRMAFLGECSGFRVAVGLPQNEQNGQIRDSSF